MPARHAGIIQATAGLAWTSNVLSDRVHHHGGPQILLGCIQTAVHAPVFFLPRAGMAAASIA
jgi:hypothetical protein